MVRTLTITAGLLENTKNKANATDVIKALKIAAKLIENLKPAGREKKETKINKATGTDTWTKKPSENKNKGNIDPTEPREMMEEIWSHGSMATSNPLVAIAGNPKPAEDDSDKPIDAHTPHTPRRTEQTPVYKGRLQDLTSTKKEARKTGRHQD